MRDSQKSRLYVAERLALMSSPNNIRHETVPEIRKFLAKVVKTKWYQKRFPKKDLVIKDGRRTRSALCTSYVWCMDLNFPRWSRSTYIILHEFAHGLVSNGKAAHGPEFCGVFLELVRKFMSKEDALRLEETFKEKKVLYYSMEEIYPQRPRRIA